MIHFCFMPKTVEDGVEFLVIYSPLNQERSGNEIELVLT